MSTLIYASNSDGCIGKCDANCYEATHDKCDCICNGMNHGAGKNKAIENTQKYADKWIEEYKERHKNEKELKCQVNSDEVYQLKLL